MVAYDASGVLGLVVAPGGDWRGLRRGPRFDAFQAAQRVPN
jgi:hypothetical protein